MQKQSTLRLSFQALGIVFGDISTSVLYALSLVFFNTLASRAGRYSVRVRNGVGEVISQTADLTVRTGPSSDPEGLAGAASMMAGMLTEGKAKLMPPVICHPVRFTEEAPRL